MSDETGGTLHNREGGLGARLSCWKTSQQDAQQWDVGDAGDIPRLEGRHSNEGKTCRPKATNCSSIEGRSDWSIMSTK